MDKKLNEKTFCKWEKEEIRQNVTLILKLTASPAFICRKCARVAKSKVNLCKPLDAETGD